MPSYQWSSRIKVGPTESIFRPSPRFKVTNHPLKLEPMIVHKQKLESNVILDPSTTADESDPLSQFVHETLMLGDTYQEDEDIPLTDGDGSKAWISKKNSILNKYTTMEKLSIISSFLPGGEKMVSRRAANVSEQVKHRLEQLDEFDDGSERQTIGLTQQEYATKIALLNEELVTAWNTEQRVKALKIAIQCSKLLADTSVVQFYPSKFVLITDILDTFGNLVFERLVGKSFKKHALPTMLEQIDPAAVADSAKETCQNWLYKMASIRELMPRLYIEMSLLKCYIFLSRNEFDSAIARLTRMIRGVGNPLVAAYARCYLCRVALNVLTKNKDFFVHNLQEFLMIYKQIFEENIRREFESQSLTKDMYLSLYVPALDWLFYGAIHFGSHPERLLDTVLAQCEDIANKDLLLYSIVSSFSSKNINIKATRILEIIGTSENIAMKHEILYLLGEHMCDVKQLSQPLSEALVQACWKLTVALRTLPHFLRVLEPWMEFASVHLSSKHLNVLLRGIIKYVSKCEESVDDYSHLLLSVIKRMLRSVDDVEELFLMDGFMPLLDMIQATQAQVEMAKSVLTLFFEKQTSPVIEDHIIIGALMRLCKILHDSVNSMTVEDEKRVVSELVSRLVQRVTFHGDWEHQLAFYVECRGAFINLDPVLLTLVYCVTRLSVDAGGGKEAGVGGGGGGARACAAFCFITLPSLGCALLKAQLYLLGGQVALLNNCIGQAEACFKLSISLIPEIPPRRLEDGQMKSTQQKVHALITNFFSTLLVVPDNIEANHRLYLLNGLLKAIQKLDWERTEPMFYSLLLKAVDLLSNLAQESYSYHIPFVISNDLLYGSDKEFIQEINNLATSMSEEILIILKQLGDTKQMKKQQNLALELFWRIVRRADVNSGPMHTLAVNLWLLSQRDKDSDNRFAIALWNSLRYENNKNHMYDDLLQKIHC